MAIFKTIRTVLLGQTRSLVSTRLYVWQWHQNLFCTTELFACVMMLSMVSGIVWMLLDVKKPCLGFAQIILEYTALALQTAPVLGIMRSLYLLSLWQRHSISLCLTGTTSFQLQEVPFCSSLVESGEHVHMLAAYSLHISLHPTTLKSQSFCALSVI